MGLAADGKPTIKDDDGEAIPLDDTAWGEFATKHLSGFLAQTTGAGAPHGKSNGGKVPVDKYAHLSPRDKMVAGFGEK